MPRLASEQVETARQLATLAELEPVVGIYYIAAQNWRDDLRPRVVYMQSPQPGEKILRGSDIAMWTFARAEERAEIVELPDLRGLTTADANSRLSELGLRTMTRRGEPKERDTTVADQFPAAGEPVIVGTSVYLTEEHASEVKSPEEAERAPLE